MKPYKLYLDYNKGTFHIHYEPMCKCNKHRERHLESEFNTYKEVIHGYQISTRNDVGYMAEPCVPDLV
jgi:hypothetical protein